MVNPPESSARKEKLGIPESTGSQGLGQYDWQAKRGGLVAALSPRGGYSGGYVPVLLLFFVIIVE